MRKKYPPGGAIITLSARARHFITICQGGAIYIYIGECVCVCVCVSFQAYTRRRLWSDRDQIWHTHADSHRKGSGQNKNLPRVTQGEFGGF